MNSNQISNLMRQDPMIKTRFRGVYPIDLIPYDLGIPSIIVVNHDKSGEKGSHWIVLHFKENDIVEHFDSIGRKPLREIHNLLFSKNLTYKYNNKRIQNYNTVTCGLFCIYYSFYSCRGMNFNRILSRFGNNLEENEEIVKRFYLEKYI